MTSPNPARDETVALLPCPFCGARAQHEPWHGGAPTKVMIQCSDFADECDVGPMVSGETFEEAAERWNRRSAAKPPSSGVDAVREAWSFLQDRLLEFEQEIGSGEEEREWAGHVHPALSRFNSLLTSLSPAATSGSEAGVRTGAEMIARHRFRLAEDGNCAEIDSNGLAEEIDAALAKPASSPAGGGVREAVARAIWKFERAPENGMTEAQQDFDWRLMRGHYEECADLVLAALSASTSAAEPVAFQQRVQPWMMACFGAEISADVAERNHRFLEESLELVQSTGCTASEAHQLVDYVYGRDIGETNQEIGGVMVTLAALCLALGEDMHAAGETELARIWTKVEKIRAKQAAKPKHSPLPQHVATPPAPAAVEGQRVKR